MLLWTQRRCRRPWCVGSLSPPRAGDNTNSLYFPYIITMPVFPTLLYCGFWLWFFVAGVYVMPSLDFSSTQGETLLQQRWGREGDATLQQHGRVPEEWVGGRQQPVWLLPTCLRETLLTDLRSPQAVSAGMSCHCLLAAQCCINDVSDCLSFIFFFKWCSITKESGQVSGTSLYVWLYCLYQSQARMTSGEKNP